MKWFGHMIRLPDATPAKQAFNHVQQDWKRPPGKPKTTWISMMKKRIEMNGKTWNEAIELAKDRNNKRACRDCLRFFL